MPSEIVTQPAMEVIPLLATRRMELPVAQVALAIADVTPPVEAPSTQAEVVVATMGGLQPNATVATPEAVVQSMPLSTQVTAPDVGRKEGDAAEGPSDVAAVVERASGESLLALTSGGSRSPA